MKHYKPVLKEAENLDELIGWFKSRWSKLSQVKNCPRFKSLPLSDQEYVMDELKAEGWK